MILTNTRGQEKHTVPYRLSFHFLLAFLCLLLMATPLLAADHQVYDQADLFTDTEIEALEASISTLVETYQVDIGIVTTNDAEGKTSQAYADDFYDYNDFGYGSNDDGLLLLIDMDNREVYISTYRLGTTYFDDKRINNVLDAVYNYLADQDYYGASTCFLNKVEAYLKAGIPSSNANTTYDGTPNTDYNGVPDTPHKPFTSTNGEPLTSEGIILSVVVAFLGAGLIALIVRACINHSYKHPRFTVAPTRPDQHSIHYTERSDQFINSHTSRTKIETSSSSGGSHGGSSTHTSSSGRSHGGGGRKF